MFQPESGAAYPVAPRQVLSETGTSVPLIQVTSFEHEQSQYQHRPRTLPQLPSHKFQHTVWHELRSTQVTGDQLKAPRVREGPLSKEETFYVTTDDAGEPIHHDRTGKERSQYRDNQENWETTVKVNLSYQKLDQAYQVKNFKRILHRMKAVEDLTIIDNSLHSLKDMSFSKCRVANLSRNYFSSFKDLPSMPNLVHLIVSFNQIKDTPGLSKYPKLESLELSGNGICYSTGYRHRIFSTLPNLKVLDGALQTETDMQPPNVDDEMGEGSCVIL